ncbi:hypothetical protein [Providencia sp. PROV237]|uniref:hypothetical protein n=1 Tax=Providencia sp. PROV237 TaxID=2949928 RepID=UPI00234BC605|nr:hypothetical protein [Providencia sp. PROV237]
MPAKKISDLRDSSRHFRHPDSPLISYPLIVEQPLGSIDKPLKIAVVGGGIAGITAIYELSRIPNAKKKIVVTLFEPDPDHFTRSPNTLSIDTARKRAGRVFSALSSTSNSKFAAAYELGAMQFPDTAGLTWHYANEVFDKSSKVDVFPNPGRVPTEFVQGERTERFQDKVWLNGDTTAKMLAAEVALGLFGNKNETDENVSLFPIGGKDPFKITAELNSSDTSPSRLQQIREEWKEFATKYDDYSIEFAIAEVIRKKIDKFPDVPNLQSNSISAKINYYVELFGRFGFGTGGFRPFFNIALVDIFREILWEYSNVYYLPVRNNVELPYKLYTKATGTNGLRVNVEYARVSDVAHSDNEAGETSAVVVYYRITDTGEEQTPNVDKFDYVILATTPKQVNSMVRRVGFNNVEREVYLGDYQRQIPLPLKVRPALVLSAQSDEDMTNAQVPVAISQIHMMTSSKIFATIKKSAYDYYAPKHPEFNNEPIKAIISDSGLGTSFVIPSKVDPNYYSFLLSYACSVDTQAMQNELLKYPKNIYEGGNRTDPKHRQMINSIINRTIRDILDPGNSSNGEKPKQKRWWLGELLSATDKDGSLTDFISYDWTTHHTSGAYKRDLPGDYYNAHLLFRYHTHALKAKTLKNRFFLAGESYSHLGGWIEGAAMSSINAVCGVIVAANQGDVSKLNTLAQQVMTTFDPVA